MKKFSYLVVVLTLTGVFAATATAGTVTGDPRKCSFNIPAQCARGAASTALRMEMTRRQYGKAVPIRWDADITCTQAGSVLRWRCTFKGGQTGTAQVWFRALASGWKRQVTVTLA